MGEITIEINHGYLENHQMFGTYTPANNLWARKETIMQMRKYFDYDITCEMLLKVYLVWKLLPEMYMLEKKKGRSWYKYPFQGAHQITSNYAELNSHYKSRN